VDVAAFPSWPVVVAAGFAPNKPDVVPAGVVVAVVVVAEPAAVVACAGFAVNRLEGAAAEEAAGALVPGVALPNKLGVAAGVDAAAADVVAGAAGFAKRLGVVLAELAGAAVLAGVDENMLGAAADEAAGAVDVLFPNKPDVAAGVVEAAVVAGVELAALPNNDDGFAAPVPAPANRLEPVVAAAGALDAGVASAGLVLPNSDVVAAGVEA